MYAVSTNQIADILHFNDNIKAIHIKIYKLSIKDILNFNISRFYAIFKAYRCLSIKLGANSSVQLLRQFSIVVIMP